MKTIYNLLSKYFYKKYLFFETKSYETPEEDKNKRKYDLKAELYFHITNYLMQRSFK